MAVDQIGSVGGADFSSLSPHDGDFLGLYIRQTDGGVIDHPDGWTTINDVDAFQVRYYIGYRLWHTGDPTDVGSTQGTEQGVFVYRNVDQDDPINANPAFDVTTDDTLLIATINNRSLSSFSYDISTSGWIVRRGLVSGGHGFGWADTEGTDVPSGTVTWPTWIMAGGGDPPGTNAQWLFALNPAAVSAAAEGWGSVIM